MAIMVRMKLSSWIRMQQKCYGMKLWFIKTPSGRIGFCKEPFDIPKLKRKYWDKSLEDCNQNFYNINQDMTHPVISTIAVRFPMEPGTQLEIRELLKRISELEKE